MTLLQINNVSMQFAGSGKPSLQHVSYQVASGDFVILLGSNGSGKSSLLKLLHREYISHTGSIELMGKPVTHYSEAEFRRHVAVLNQDCEEALFPSLTLYENYLLMSHRQSLFTRHRSERAFLMEALQEFNPNLSHKLDLPVSQLSGGEKQTLALAFCLLQPPKILLLDEHTSALDPKTSAQIMRLTQAMITQHHMTCILTTHDLDIAMQYGNRILMLNEGRIQHMFDEQEKCRLTKEDLIRHYY
ncbi:Choline transport ATP-binding protein OpuBA [Aquicella siphonis]|uniref:Choline transport ATP-binding protein OpuBA n=1 Tax=Aquicella siphonis TaxID=254247 RepID=A0A5E4PEH4_9COXI|nr:ATP-binding cassette domain-containing protein [Aquicella siphonis]VVC74878.1 Choline transport ATP-binding protein OpuBA [Aquicella siphonis]